MVCIFIGAMAVYYVINKIQNPEQIEQEENEKYLEELKVNYESFGTLTFQNLPDTAIRRAQ